MKRLILEEDENIQVDPIEVPEDKTLMASNVISTLIKNSWDSVDLYNSMIVSLNDMSVNEPIDTLNDIINSLYINIGQLEKVLQDINIQAQAMNDDLGEVVVPEDEIQVDME